MRIPYGRQTIEDDDIRAVEEVLRSDYITTGPKSAEFEKKIAKYTGAKYAVSISNGTAALHAACFAAGIKQGDEVITTPMTFAASANCALYMGAVPVFADIDPKTYNIDPYDIRRKLTPKTKAIIAVHFTGQPCDMDEIQKIADEYNLIVIEDAAHALGAWYKDRRIGGISDMTTFSFHPVKHITTGEGGMILTNNEELYKKLRLFRNHGITKDPELMSANEGGWFYEQQLLGYNYRLSDMQCALGINQLLKLDGFLSRRKEIVERYYEELKDEPEITLPYQADYQKNAWHLFVIQVPKERRRIIYDGLIEAGIFINIHYIPVYHHPYYRANGYKDTYCKNVEELYAGLLTLPVYPGLKEEEQSYVIMVLKKLLKQ